MNESNTRKSWLRRFFGWLWSPSKRSLLALLSIGFVVGILFWGGLHTALEATNSTEFCIGCHDMRDTVYQEYKETIHYQNRSGVQATCPDCHVPKPWGPMIYRKMQASLELFAEWSGKIDTKEKFETHRMEMASIEWARMKAHDSRECRNCHTWAAMAKDKQRPRAQAQHISAQKEGKTCIDCHKGIAHLLPKEYAQDEE